MPPDLGKAQHVPSPSAVIAVPPSQMSLLSSVLKSTDPSPLPNSMPYVLDPFLFSFCSPPIESFHAAPPSRPISTTSAFRKTRSKSELTPLTLHRTASNPRSV